MLGYPGVPSTNLAHSVQPFGRQQGTYIGMYCFII